MGARQIPVVMQEGALSEPAHDASPSAPLAGPAPVYLHVAGAGISEAEIAKEMQMHRAASPHESRRQAARTLVIGELVRLECARLGLAPAPEHGETDDEALARQLLEREVATPVPDDEACRRYYDANRERLHRPDRLRVRHILLAAPPADVAARQRAARLGEELIAALREVPERFAEFAMRHSACPSREAQGDLGWLERGDTVPEFDRQLFMLRVGLAGLTVETRYGHHVVMVDAIERGTPLSFAQARARIAAYLETQVRQNAVHQYLRILAERFGVEGMDQIEDVA
jgi:peptidyl-prolyl cis-trans isomerase C